MDAVYDVVGVFRDRSHADGAIDALKRADFREDQIGLAVYAPDSTEEIEEGDNSSRRGSEMRVIVHVKSDGREQDAVGILFQNGANNADLPSGTMLVHGSIVSANEAPVDLMPEQSVPEAPPDRLITH